jgi:hypothetical protein
LVFGISSPLAILDQSPSHSRGSNYFGQPLPQSTFDQEDFFRRYALIFQRYAAPPKGHICTKGTRTRSKKRLRKPEW